MPDDYVELPGSYREPPKTAVAIASVHAVNPSEEIEVSVYLKDRDADPLQQPPMSAKEFAARAQPAPSAEALNTQRQDSYKEDIDAISQFASSAGLSVVKVDPARRLIKISGPADKLEAAFRTKLHYYNDGKTPFRARAGVLSVPSDIVGRIDAVLGLDTRPIAKPKLMRHIDPHAIVGHLPNEIGKMYRIPKNAWNGGRTVHCADRTRRGIS